MRRAWVLLHRWCGLFSAAFLALAGLTGALIAWNHELDAWLNPAFFRAPGDGPMLSALDLADRLEAAEPRLRVSGLPLHAEPGHALTLFVVPSSPKDTLGFDEVAVDPHTGKALARRQWGAISLAPLQLMPFLYRLHYSLHLPEAGGLDVGMWLMGIVAMVWTLDAFIALYISFPNRKVWRRSFAFRLRGGGRKALFDLHRSSGVWLWPVLLGFAVTAVSMNLGDAVVRPVVNAFSPLAPDPFASPKPELAARTPRVERAQAVALATTEARKRGIHAPAGSVFHAAKFGFYSVDFFTAGNDYGDGSLGNPRLLIDAQSGSLVAAQQPGIGSAGDLFMQAQFPLHSGRLLGTLGRVLVTILGLTITTLSVTGVWLWAKKQLARAHKSA